jgi:hypothetical protein
VFAVEKRGGFGRFTGFWRTRMPSISGYNALTAGNGARDKRGHAVKSKMAGS